VADDRRADATAPGERPEAIATASAPLFWAQVLGNAGLFLAVVPIARALGPGGRGTVAFITVTGIVAATVARLGVTEATTVFAAERPSLRPALLANLLLSVTGAAAGAAVVVCGGLLLAPSLRPAGVGDAELVVLALAMLTSGLADAGYMFVLGCSRFRLHAAVTVTAAWLYAGTIGLVAATAGLTVLRATLIWVAFQAAKAIVLLAASVRAEGVVRPDAGLLGESVAFGARAWIGTLSTAFNERVDQILVALLASEAALGIYATAVNAFEILVYLAGATATAILPLAARADPARRAERVLGAFRSVALLTLLGMVVAIVAGPPLIPLVFGRPFDASTEPFLWLLPGAVGFVALAIFSNALVAASSPGRSSAGPLVSLALGVILDLLLIPPLGATGAAVAASAALLAGGTVSLVLFRLHGTFPLRAVVVPERDDLALLRAVVKPFWRGRLPGGRS
jgi:O-antigen/teichoic acid export membrane protein